MLKKRMGALPPTPSAAQSPGDIRKAPVESQSASTGSAADAGAFDTLLKKESSQGFQSGPHPAAPPGSVSSATTQNLPLFAYIAMAVAGVVVAMAAGIYVGNRHPDRVGRGSTETANISSSPQHSAVANERSRELAETQAKLASAKVESAKAQAEAAKAQTELARQKLQSDDLQRERESDRKLMEIAQQQAQRAQQQSQQEQQQARIQAEHDRALKSWEDVINSRADELGKRLLACVHSTGSHESTDAPIITRSADRKYLNVVLTVQWKGLIRFDPYTTIFSFRLSKEGLNTFSISDTAFAPILESEKAEAEAIVSDLFIKG